MTSTICPHCGDKMVLDLLEVWPEDRAWLFETCCESLNQTVCDDLDYAISMPLRERQQFLEPLRALFEGCGLPFRLVYEDDLQLAWEGGIRLRPVALDEAKAFIALHHRHNQPPVVWLWGHGIVNGAQLVAVATVERPKARMIATRDPRTVEVTRVCVNHDLAPELTWNACSMLYGAAAREAARRGYTKVITYTLESEAGHTLEAAGWVREYLGRGGSWGRKDRPRSNVAPTEPKWRWARHLRPKRRREVAVQDSLFVELAS